MGTNLPKLMIELQAKSIIITTLFPVVKHPRKEIKASGEWDGSKYSRIALSVLGRQVEPFANPPIRCGRSSIRVQEHSTFLLVFGQRPKNGVHTRGAIE